MKFLLDTHVFLWYIKGDSKLPKTIITRIAHASEVYISSASIWECAIKVKLKKLDANLEDVVESIAKSGFLELPITSLHTVRVASLPEIHRDPFDRILIAQSISEPLTFLTADTILKKYSDLVEVID